MFVIMFFISLFMPLIMIDSPNDFYVGPNQIYGATFMSAAMILLGGHSTNQVTNVFLLVLCILCAIGIRYQVGINPTQYLRDMIPHHSMAILTSKKQAGDTDPVQRLATTILDTQVREIALMKSML